MRKQMYYYIGIFGAYGKRIW